MPKSSETHSNGSSSPFSSNLWLPRLESISKESAIAVWLSGIEQKMGPAALHQAMREVCKNDLFWLCKRVLGYSDLEEPLHDDMCDFLAYTMKNDLNSLLLIPRAHFKSTIATIGATIQDVIRNPNVRVGLFSGDMKNARKFALEIRNQMETNVVLKSLFPEIFYNQPKKESSKWTTDEFTVRRDPVIAARLKEGTVKIFGLLQNIPTGDHFDILRGDDIVDQDIVSSQGQMAKIEEQLDFLIPLQQRPDDPIHLVGTRYHILDAYGKIIEDGHYKVYLRKDVENNNVIFPGRFSKKMLETTRVRIGNYKYYCQYRLDPQDPGDKKFKLEWLKEFDNIPVEKESRPYYSMFMMVDPANKMKKESDFTAMGVYAVDHDFNVFMVDGCHDKLNPKERIDKVFDLVKKWSLAQVGYETIAFQDTDAFWIKQKMVKDNIFFQIIEINHRKQNKFDYIMSIQPLFQSGKFHLPKKGIQYQRIWENPDDGLAREVDLCDIFKKQYDFFPNLAHDDAIDNVAMAMTTVQAGRVPRPQQAPDFTSPYPKKKKDDFDYRAH